MNYSLSNMLSNGSVSGIDPDAKAYIAAVVAAGATVTSSQKNAINQFYKTTKTDGYYNQIKRFYLPIWGIAAANAIDLISFTSGTFVGGVTHNSGFIQGNGTNGRFAINTSPVGVGMIVGSSSTFALVKVAQGTFNAIIVSTPTSGKGNGFTYAVNITGYFAGRVAGINVSGVSNGILIESETAINSRYFRRRTTAGATSLNTNTDSVSGSYATFNQSVLAGQSAGNSFYGFSTSEVGAFGMGLVLTTSQADALTLQLKNLWETCTGLTLP